MRWPTRVNTAEVHASDNTMSQSRHSLAHTRVSTPWVNQRRTRVTANKILIFFAAKQNKERSNSAAEARKSHRLPWRPPTGWVWGQRRRRCCRRSWRRCRTPASRSTTAPSHGRRLLPQGRQQESRQQHEMPWSFAFPASVCPCSVSPCLAALEHGALLKKH